MTLGNFFGGSPGVAREPPTMPDNLETYYGAIDRGGHGWKPKSDIKKTKSTLSALTLLAFLFFLNLLLSCLKDTLQGSDPEIIVVPQQRVTRRVSGQLIGLVGPMGDTGPPAIPVPAADPVTAPVKPDHHHVTILHGEDFTAKGGQRIRAANRTKRSVDGPGRDIVADVMAIFWPPSASSHSPVNHLDGDSSVQDYETSIESPATLRDTEEVLEEEVANLSTLGPLEYMDVEPEYLGWETVEDVNEDLERDVADVTLPTYEATSDQDQQGNATEPPTLATTEAPTTLPHATEVITTADEVYEEGDEQTQNVSEECNDSTGCEADDHKDTVSDDLIASSEEQDDPGAVQHETTVVEQQTGIQNVFWEDLKALWTGITRGVAAKGLEESLDSLQHPGVGLWNIGEQMIRYAMPILRDATMKFGFDPARCKELVVCETSRLAWMWGDQDVTSAFNGVFEWLYGMEEPELRSINKEWKKKKKKSCRYYIKRCKVEAGDESWLPMIANVLEYMVT